jgi:hypothetical protein
MGAEFTMDRCMREEHTTARLSRGGAVPASKG